MPGAGLRLQRLPGIPNAAITFEPVGGGPLGAANTDSQGRFQLATSDRNGVVPGQYRVAVTKYELLNIDLSKPGDFSTLEVRWIVPQRYSQLNTSGLQFKLDGHVNDLRLELQP